MTPTPDCLAHSLGSDCCGMCPSTGKGTVLQKKLCAECKGAGGFYVELQYVRRVPTESLQAIKKAKNSGATVDGSGFHLAPDEPFQFCLCNDPQGKTCSDPLVLLRPGHGTPPASWEQPSSAEEYGQKGVPQGKLRLYAMLKTVVPVKAQPGGGRVGVAVVGSSVSHGSGGNASSSGATSADSGWSGAAS